MLGPMTDRRERIRIRYVRNPLWDQSICPHCNLSVDASSVVEAGDGVAERVQGDRGGGARRPRPGVKNSIDIQKTTNMI